jgi:hypothetical protein
MIIDYVRVYQGIENDSEPPTNFTASVGTTTGSSIELILNALDNSGNIVYTVDYGDGLKTVFNPSGIEKSLIISDLSPNTNYTFTITASDSSGNVTLNSPIMLNAATIARFECAGTGTQATEGAFSLGYKYAFETLGTDVKITFEMLDTNKVGVVAYLWKQSPFSEVQMANVSGNIFTKTITGQTTGNTINYAVKFAFAGGLSVTKYISYVVGSNCPLGIQSYLELKQSYFPNPVENLLHLELSENQNHITLTNMLGQKQLETTAKSVHDIDMSALKSGVYFLIVRNSRGVENVKIIKK